LKRTPNDEERDKQPEVLDLRQRSTPRGRRRRHHRDCQTRQRIGVRGTLAGRRERRRPRMHRIRCCAWHVGRLAECARLVRKDAVPCFAHATLYTL
jgi:hypothetical protein